MDKNELIEEFSKCRENLERYAVSLTGNIEDAEDLVSDLCIALLERNTDVEEIRFPRAFFNTSLRHMVYNSSLRKGRCICIDPTGTELNSIIAKSANDMAHIEFLLSLNKQLAKYLPDLAEAFYMRYLDGYPLQEVARQMGLPSNTLAQKFKRLRKALALSDMRLWLFVITFIFKI